MNVLVTGHLPGDILGRITAEHKVTANDQDRPMDRQAIRDAVADADGLLCMITDTVDADLLDAAPQLKIVANFGVGYNNIDVSAASVRQVMVTNTPGVLTDATADLTLALMLGISRRMVESDRHTRAGKFQFWAPFYFLGSQISGKTLGIVGMGRIGCAVARRAAGFGMRILYHNRRQLTRDRLAGLDATWADLDTLIETSDVVTLHVPLTDRTRHLIGAAQLARMKPSAYLINTARGPVVDEAALLAALKNGAIAGAGLDVYENEPALTPGLADLDNVILLPHVGSATVETRRQMAQKAVDNLLAGLAGRRPPNVLNPEILNGAVS